MASSNSKNSVFIMTQNRELQEIGSITSSNNNRNNRLNLKKIGIDTVDDFNHKILNYISSDKGHITDVFNVIESGDIFGVIIHILRWRQCTGYLVIQKSSQGVRYLCYLYSKIKHSGGSFATSCESVTNDDNFRKIKEGFIESKTKFQNILKMCDSAYKLKNGLNKVNTNFDRLFGI